MALKFLNKKGWHTGSLRNIENVWKAEQKHEAEQRKLEELRKQILEERERDEFRRLQEQAGLTPRQERLEFLYDSGLAVGKTSSEGFKALESHPPPDNNEKPASASASASAPSSSNAATPGALFEDKPQSANDAWRKLHSDPLLMIRQREQEALARIKNNPIKMAMIRKSVTAETKKKDDENDNGERQKVKSKHKKHSSSKHHSDSEDDSHKDTERKRKKKHKKKEQSDSDEDSKDRARHHRQTHRDPRSEKQRHSSPERHGDHEQRKRSSEKPRNEEYPSDEDSKDRAAGHYRHSYRDPPREKQRTNRYEDHEQRRRRNEKSRNEEYPSDEDLKDRARHHRHSHRDPQSEKPRHSSPDKYEDHEQRKRSNEKSRNEDDSNRTALPPRHDSYKRRGRGAPQLSEEERAARLREMQMDAEVHEEQRWKRLKKADEDDAREASREGPLRGKSFLDAVHKSVYGAEKGGSSTIEESVRRRSHFLQSRSDADERNAFRR